MATGADPDGPAPGLDPAIARGRAPSPVKSPCRVTIELPAWSVVPGAVLFADQSADAMDSVVGPDDTAYLAFTSGTTGKQKAVVGTHRPLSHFLKWHVETWGLASSDRFALLSGLGHDPLLRDLFTPWWIGATLCIPSAEPVESVGRLAHWLREQRASVIHVTPTLSRLLCQTADADWPDLRYVFFGGEALRERDVLMVRRLAPGRRSFVNYYGATETPQAMGFYTAKDPDPGNPSQGIGRVLPLGQGIDGVQLLVLNEADQLAGVGEVGEIHVRTSYLSRGYLNLPDLTPREVHYQPIFGGPDRSHLSDGRPGAMARRWAPGICRAQRPTGQVAGLSNRTGLDRGDAARTSRS